MKSISPAEKTLSEEIKWKSGALSTLTAAFVIMTVQMTASTNASPWRKLENSKILLFPITVKKNTDKKTV